MSDDDFAEFIVYLRRNPSACGGPGAGELPGNANGSSGGYGMTIDDIRSRSLALTREIREAESRGQTEEVMQLMRQKQPLVAMLYQYGCAVEHGRGRRDYSR